MLQATEVPADEILRFWFGPPGTRGRARPEWFRKDPAFDQDIRAKFLELHEKGAAGALTGWRERAGECLALIILLDQFPRNMFRDSAQSFASDALALEAARHALAAGHAHGALPVERLFFSLPFEHSEVLADQDVSCSLIEPLAAFPETAGVWPFALKHREIVARFGRFPHRNDLLGRISTPEEIEFLRQPGSRF
jgi:uncharacterized protein (DUF924 family)